MPIQCTAEDPRPPRLPPRQPRRPRPPSDEESSSEEDAGSWDAESNEYSSGGWEEAARPPTPDESTFAVPPPPAAAGPRTHAVQARLATAECTVEDLGARGEIATGICFLDHMIDQLQSHGQLGVALRCRVGDGPWARPNEPLGAAADEAVHIVGACGEALGGLELDAAAVKVELRSTTTKEREREHRVPRPPLQQLIHRAHCEGARVLGRHRGGTGRAIVVRWLTGGCGGKLAHGVCKKCFESGIIGTPEYSFKVSIHDIKDGEKTMVRGVRAAKSAGRSMFGMEPAEFVTLTPQAVSSQQDRRPVVQSNDCWHRAQIQCKKE